ncbi:hypothetical protein F2Q70_00008706 [Brassica cretica]|uniref:Replication factor A C-terminal domain-containing protein n=1 Tax=Brassica cretica TaxID=69181 RepID=A0A8S9M8E8_BRACR|nr:hypothetical protein F2Q70_00008706 [Brassica cretica]
MDHTFTRFLRGALTAMSAFPMSGSPCLIFLVSDLQTPNAKRQTPNADAPNRVCDYVWRSRLVVFSNIAAWSRCCGKATPYFNPVTEEIEANKYACDSCEKDETITSIRYKLQVKVADHTGSTSFLLFNREVIQLIHKSAYELLEQQVQFNRDDEIPQELLDLEGKKIVWVIRVKGTVKKPPNPGSRTGCGSTGSGEIVGGMTLSGALVVGLTVAAGPVAVAVGSGAVTVAVSCSNGSVIMLGVGALRGTT